jgi:glucose/arabinose dehydrogenase
MRPTARSRSPTALTSCGVALAILTWAVGARAQSEDGRFAVPDGFAVQLFADELAGPLAMAFGPDGQLYVTLGANGSVVRLADVDGDGRAEDVVTVIEGLDRPLSIAWLGDDLWVAEAARVIRARMSGIDAPTDLEVVVDSLPSDGPGARSLLFEPSGRAFYLAMPAACNLCREDDPRLGTILRVGIDGEEEVVWARGLRSVGGLAFHPVTGELWATDIGREGLGDRLPPDELNIIRRGRHYGWPYCYGQRLPNPEFADTDRCDVTVPPILSFRTGSIPQGLAFYTGDVFPAEYRGDAFVALRGSAESGSVDAGHRVVRVRVEAGRPIGLEDFVTGWLDRPGDARGGPSAMLVGPDGALYVCDDGGDRIWRVVYRQRGDGSVDAG